MIGISRVAGTGNETDDPAIRPVYIGQGVDAVFGMFHGPAKSADRELAILICPPWGWDEEASYRARRTWAQHLAAHGYETLRIDFPGTGDSGGDPSAPNRVDAWRRAVVEATTWLAGHDRPKRVVVIGLGIGGLIAGMAISDGAPIDGLVLWGTPIEGRAFIREQRAFARFQSSRYGPTPASDTGLPDGWLEAGGYVLSSETITEIEAMGLRSADLGSLRRALLMGRDGVPVSTDLRSTFEAAQVEIETATGDGWTSMCFHPERHEPPLEVFERLDQWLVAQPQDYRRTSIQIIEPSAIPPCADQAELTMDGAIVRETTIGPAEGLDGSFGVLAAPGDDRRPEVCAVLLNAGAIRRVGPNRMWVDVARRWAAAGIPAFRADMDGIGDAEGDAGAYREVARFYAPERRVHVTGILDALVRRGMGPRFVVIGLCAGGYWGFDVGADDPRVIEVIAINPKVLVWDEELELRRDARLVERVFSAGPWRRLLTGETDGARVLAIGRAIMTQTARKMFVPPSQWRRRSRVDPISIQIADTLDRLRGKHTRVVLAFSGDEQVPDELERGGILSRLDDWPNVTLEDLPYSDHTVRPMAAQHAVGAILDRELAGLIDR